MEASAASALVSSGRPGRAVLAEIGAGKPYQERVDIHLQRRGKVRPRSYIDLAPDLARNLDDGPAVDLAPTDVPCPDDGVPGFFRLRPQPIVMDRLAIGFQVLQADPRGTNSIDAELTYQGQ